MESYAVSVIEGSRIDRDDVGIKIYPTARNNRHVQDYIKIDYSLIGGIWRKQSNVAMAACLCKHLRIK